MIAREREREGDEFADKDQFVTPASWPVPPLQVNPHDEPTRSCMSVAVEGHTFSFLSAELRKQDRLRAEDKMIAREREREGDEFADKDQFVFRLFVTTRQRSGTLRSEALRPEHSPFCLWIPVGQEQAGCVDGHSVQGEKSPAAGRGRTRQERVRVCVRDLVLFARRPCAQNTHLSVCGFLFPGLLDRLL
jgi:hypothetical protein